MSAFINSLCRFSLTGLMVAVALWCGYKLWDYYFNAPWTRDGHVRADVVPAPQRDQTHLSHLAGARPIAAAVVAIGAVIIDGDPALIRLAVLRRCRGARNSTGCSPPGGPSRG